MSHDPTEPAAHGAPAVTVTVDDEPVTTTDRSLTPVQIMGLAHVDPATHYLVRIEGRHQTSYRDDPVTPIELQPGETFVTVSTRPTPVS